MIDFLYNLDLQLFLFINKSISNSIFDTVFTFLHQPYKNVWFIILILILPLGIFVTDTIGSSIKKIELRKRPYMNIENKDINLLVKVKKGTDGEYINTKSARKSFPSNHSANIFFIYFILSILYPKKRLYFLTIAIIVGVSRIYVGVHYPFDVISGMGIGLFVGFILQKILIRKNIIR